MSLLMPMVTFVSGKKEENGWAKEKKNEEEIFTYGMD
jgi:hypothetical protein